MPPDKMPNQPATVEIEKIPAWAIAQTEKLNKVLETVSNVANNVSDIVVRVEKVEEKIVEVVADVAELKGARTANSMKVKTMSDNDMAQESKIADGIMKATAFESRLTSFEKTLATNTAVTLDVQKTQAKGTDLSDLKELVADVRAAVKSPLVKIVIGVVLALLGFIAQHGVKFL